MEAVRPIRPELLASKIEKIENFEQLRLGEEFGDEPRLVRALWYLQYVSQPANYPGGLSKFASDFVAAAAHKIGTAEMLKPGPFGKNRYRLSDAINIFARLPGTAREELFGPDAWLVEEAFISGSSRKMQRDLGELLLAKLTPASLKELCSDAARSYLAAYFVDVCELPHVGLRHDGAAVPRPFTTSDDLVRGHGAPWYFAAVSDALLEFIESRATTTRARLAETEVTREITRWTAKARNMRRAVMFIGNSRFGKTEAIKTEAEANPGSCRLVNTPASNAIGDLLREVAKSLGLEVGPKNSGQTLHERIDYVLRFSRLQLIFDESQLLLPGSYSRNTAPARLNWVRRSIMDQDISAVFVCTPQSYLPAKRRFVNATGFAMEQFDERILKTVELPTELSEADLLAVARIHFSGLANEYLRYVVDKALATERNFVSDIEKIATLAKDNAREHGRPIPKFADIEAAIADVLPTPRPAPPAPPASRRKGSATSIPTPCKANATPVPARRFNRQPLPIPTRNIAPAITA